MSSHNIQDDHPLGLLQRARLAIANGVYWVADMLAPFDGPPVDLKVLRTAYRRRADGGVEASVTARHEAAKFIGFLGHEMLGGAENYVATSLEITAPHENQKYDITVERVGGKTTAEKIYELENALEQACRDLNAAHDKIVQLQDEEAEVRKQDWPEWSSPANTIRWAEELLGKRIAKTEIWTLHPNEQS